MIINVRGVDARLKRLHDQVFTAMLIVQCLLIFIALPCAATGYPGSRVAVEGLFIVFAALIIMIARGPAATTIAILAMALVTFGAITTLFAPAADIARLSPIGNIIGGLIVGFVVGHAVLAPGGVTIHRVVGAIVVYLNLGLIFASAYRLIWNLHPGSMTGIDLRADSLDAAGDVLYFSFVTLTTIGYGDIVPVHPLARSLANLEGIIGQLYPATLLARLITLEIQGRRS